MKGWKNVLSVVVFVVLCAAVVMLIVYGRSTYTEPGLLQVCWQLDGQACYADDCQCQERDPLIWSQGVPLTVVTVDNEGRVLSPAPDVVGGAMRDINSQLRATFLEAGTDLATADIVLTYRAAFEVDAERGYVDRDPGYCRHWIEDGRLRAAVYVRPAGALRHEYRVTFHELGHALGLAHDEHTGSIMYPTVWDDRDDARMSFTMFSEWDRRVLRETYGFEER
jgi:hypothetical protein